MCAPLLAPQTPYFLITDADTFFIRELEALTLIGPAGLHTRKQHLRPAEEGGLLLRCIGITRWDARSLHIPCAGC